MNRREALARLGVISAGSLLAACGEEETPRGARAPSGTLAERFDRAATCRPTTEQTEGPYHLELERIRADITEGREGTPLRLGLRVRDAATCEPLPNAAVEIWQCDATGVYSGVEGDGGTFLRGAQVTNDEGIVQFRTLYPGRYPGRTAHIHAKVLLGGGAVLTTQVYFDEAVSERVYAQAPYSDDSGVTNSSDGFFSPDLVLSVSKEQNGWLGLMTFDVSV